MIFRSKDIPTHVHLIWVAFFHAKPAPLSSFSEVRTGVNDRRIGYFSCVTGKFWCLEDPS